LVPTIPLKAYVLLPNYIILIAILFHVLSFSIIFSHESWNLNVHVKALKIPTAQHISHHRYLHS
jgi:hypothetical protein